MKRQTRDAAVALGAAIALTSLAATADAAGTVSGVSVRDDGAMPMPTFDLPWSTFASPQARDYIVRQFHTSAANLPDILRLVRKKSK